MATNNLDFYQKYTNFILINSEEAENGTCIIWTGATQRRNNYVLGMINVTYPNAKRTKMNVARLAKILQLKSTDLAKNLDASHLCHNALCVNTDHIVLEPREINNQRKICVAAHQCTTHIVHGTNYTNCMLNLKLWFVMIL